MRRGESSGGGQSSLGYLFGANDPQPKTKPEAVSGAVAVAAAKPDLKPANPPPHSSSSANNYRRDDGQNSGNFITGRPFTKVHNAPGGGSSLGYLFGGQK